MTVKQPLSDLLVHTISVARANGSELVRLPGWTRGCWTLRSIAMPKQGRPEFWVSDNTVKALLSRSIAEVTHMRAGTRPAVIRVRSEEEMKPVPVTPSHDPTSFGPFPSRRGGPDGVCKFACNQIVRHVTSGKLYRISSGRTRLRPDGDSICFAIGQKNGRDFGPSARRIKESSLEAVAGT